MSDWSAGYVSDVGYTYGYYPELNPHRVRLALASNGLASPNIQTACELGFGQGISINFHSAASQVDWFGTDFNPSQAAFAQELVRASGSGAKLSDSAFAAYVADESLPGFDFIALHGIWSWISESNRDHIIQFIRNKLNVGGVLYLSYNTLPGWSSFAPMRHLMTQHASVLGSQGAGTINRVDEAVSFAQRLLKIEPRFLLSNPAVAERLERLAGQGRHYLAHEYFNKDWMPMHFADVAERLQDAKLQYAGSAHYLDYVDSVNLRPEQIEFLANIPDTTYRQSVRDFMVNQQFRRDYWVKGARQISVLEQVESLREQAFILTVPRNDVAMTVKGDLGEATLSEDVYRPILDALADHSPKTIADLETVLADEKVDIGQLCQAVLVLAASGTLMTTQSEDEIEAVKERTDRLNTHLFNRARSSGDIAYLASPVIGGGIGVGQIEQLFTACSKHGAQDPEAWADEVWGIVNSQGQKLLKDGVPLETDGDNLSELKRRAETFFQDRVPIMKALKIL